MICPLPLNNNDNNNHNNNEDEDADDDNDNNNIKKILLYSVPETTPSQITVVSPFVVCC